MRFALLGSLRLRSQAEWTSVRSPQRRQVLSLLLLNVGRVVATDRLVQELWGAHPPPSAVNAVQGHVMRLRQAMGQHVAGRLTTQPSGYQLRLEDNDLDLDVFNRLAESGQGHVIAGRLDRGAEELEQALDLWRNGPAMADVPTTPLIAAKAAQLDRRRLDVLESRLSAEVGLGRHAAVLAELDELIGENPLREQLRALHMTALYRSGRRAEALESFRLGREVLVDQLGMEPGPQLQDLHELVLVDHPALSVVRDGRTAADPHFRRDRRMDTGATAGSAQQPGDGGAKGSATSAQPAELPMNVPHFIGRRGELAALNEMLDLSQPPTVGIAALSGPAGVGRRRWPHTGRTRSPSTSRMVSCSCCCAVRVAGSRCPPAKLSSGSFGRREQTVPTCPPTRRNERRATGQRSRAAGCSWCSTTPPASSR